MEVKAFCACAPSNLETYFFICVQQGAMHLRCRFQLRVANAQALAVAICSDANVDTMRCTTCKLIDYLIDVVTSATVLAVEVGSHAETGPQRVLKLARADRIFARLDAGRRQSRLRPQNKQQPSKDLPQAS